jgi:hypothetical protein
VVSVGLLNALKEVLSLAFSYNLAVPSVGSKVIII